MKKEKKIVTTNELSLLINKSKQTISDYVRQGMPRLSEGKYDAKKCAAWLKRKEENINKKKILIEKIKQEKKAAAKARKKDREKAKQEKKYLKKTCLFCHKTFTAKQNFSRFIMQKFCSSSCSSKHKAVQANVTASCLNCGNMFQKKKSQKKKYCSHACAESHLVLVKCDYCSAEFKAKATTATKFCSDKCYRDAHRSPQRTIRGRMTTAIKKALVGQKSGRSWELLVGYSLKQLCEHIESLFTDGMSWQNMGEWHIDHIIPQSKFNYVSTEDPDFKKCWSLKNLQPLWAKNNLIKSDSLDKPFQPSLSFSSAIQCLPAGSNQFATYAKSASGKSAAIVGGY